MSVSKHYLEEHFIRDGHVARREKYDPITGFLLTGRREPDTGLYHYSIYFDPGRTHFFGFLPYHSTSKSGTKELQSRCSSKCIFCGGTSPGCKPYKKANISQKHAMRRLEIESRLQQWNADGMVAAKLHYIFTFFYYLQFFLLKRVLPKAIFCDYYRFQSCRRALTYWLYDDTHRWLRYDMNDRIKISCYSNEKIFANDFLTFLRESKAPCFSPKQKNRFLCISEMSQILVRKLVISRTFSSRKKSNFAKEVILNRFFQINSISRSIQAAGLTFEQMELYNTFHFWSCKFVNQSRLKNNF